MNQKLLYKVFIWGFLLLYLLVAAISFFHAIQFFNVGNNMAMSVVLAFAFEIGLALSLAAVLLSDANKRATLPWILMIVLTSVQVIGNVFSTFKFMSMSGTEYYQYLAKPLLFWIEGVSEYTVQIVVSWIIGAILPIIALFMTDMVATNIKNLNDVNKLPETKNEGKGDNEYKVEDKPKENEKAIPIPSNYMPPTDSSKIEAEEVIKEKEEESIPIKEKLVTEDENAVNEDFWKAAVSEVKVPAEKKGLLKKIGNRLKPLWMGK